MWSQSLKHQWLNKLKRQDSNMGKTLMVTVCLIQYMIQILAVTVISIGSKMKMDLINSIMLSNII